MELLWQLSLKLMCIALSTHIHIAQSKGPSKGAVGKVQCQGLAGHGLSSLSWLAVAFCRGGPKRARFGSCSPPLLITALPGNQRVQSQSNSWWGPNCKLILSELCKQITLILPCIYFSLVHMETQPSLKIPYHLLYPPGLWSWCPLLIPAVANSCVRQRLWEIPVGQNKLWDVIMCMGSFGERLCRWKTQAAAAESVFVTQFNIFSLSEHRTVIY